jgi:uncharacterized protein (DUF1697 family)
MQKYISILRGINVGGTKKIQMAELKVLYEELDFKDVITYIQSGNVIFESGDAINLSTRIEEKILAKYNFTVPVIIRSVVEMRAIVNTNPFLGEDGIHRDKLHLTFLKELPGSEVSEKIRAGNNRSDRFVINSKEIYLYCPGGYGTTKLNNNFFEQSLKTVATTRNWKTVIKLLELAEGI